MRQGLRTEREPLRISAIRASFERGVHRVIADVEGSPLWFESPHVELRASGEALASALLLPALHRKSRLTLDEPVGSTWLSNIEKLMDVWHEWWGYPRLLPQVELQRQPPAAASPRTALCFSAGVDSFYSLISRERKPDLLVTGHGFDIPLHDQARMNALEASLHAAAASCGAQPIVIRTNFREHPAAGPPALWERSHGGVLAAVGHMLSGAVGQLTISSSYSYRILQPWGTSPSTDPFWSSDQLTVVHYGTDATRERKLQLLAEDPLVRGHLRVCWENRAPTGNCSRCGKCLSVMLILAELGVLREFPVFDDETVLVRRLDALPYMTSHVNITDRLVRRARLQPEIIDAARRLVRRSRRAISIRGYADRVRSALRLGD